MGPGTAIIVVVGPAVMLLIAGISGLAGHGRLRRNGFVGLRLPSTMASDAGWEAGHRAAVRPALIAAVVLVGADAIALLVARSGSLDAVATVALVVLTLGGVVTVSVLANRAAWSAQSS